MTTSQTWPKYVNVHRRLFIVMRVFCEEHRKFGENFGIPRQKTATTNLAISHGE